MRRKLDETRGDVHGPNGRRVATSVETITYGEEKTIMLPLLTADHADLLYQALLALTAAVTIVFTSLATWLRC